MNNLVIPPSANWYEASILACAPDNTLIYGSRNDIVIIYDSPNDQPADVKIIPRAHSQKIVSTNINKNWGQPYKLLVTVAEDNIIKLWDIDSRKKKHGHNSHVGHGKVVGATFAGDDRVISVSEDGIIIVWNVILNQTNVLKEIFGLKVTITCISTCPHANWLTAFGLKNGLVIVTDLRKQGKVLYKLRGHDKSVLALSWCPAPVNIFPKDPHNRVGVKNSTNTEQNPEVNQVLDESNRNETSEKDCDDPVEIKLENEIFDLDSTGDATCISKSATNSNSKPIKKFNRQNIWSNLKHADDDDDDPGTSHEKEKSEDCSSDNDFLQDCQNLKDIIAAQNASKPLTIKECDNEKSRVNNNIILKAKRNKSKTLKTQEENLENNEKSSTVIISEIEEIHNVETSAGTVAKDFNIQNQTEHGTQESLEKNIATSQNKGVYDLVEDTELFLNEITTKLRTDVPQTEKCTSEEEVADKVNSNKEISAIYVDKNDAEGSLDESIKDKSCESPKDEGGKICVPEVVDEIIKIDSESDRRTVEDSSPITCGEAKREIPVKKPIEEEPRREFLLASSGKEGNIYIWRAGTDGRMQTFLSIPNKQGQRRSGKSNSDKLWIVLCWITPTILLSSSKSAELGKWVLPKPKDKSKQFSIIHNDHNSILFSIAAPIVLLNEHNWLDEKELNVWTVGHDRMLLNTRLSSERKNLACYPTLGNAECFALSPVDPNRLAIGTAEGIIRIWDLSRPNIKNIVMISFFQKIQGKVVTIAWHPTEELILAYGTVEGRVGIMDTSNKSKAPIVTPNFFKCQIHKVEWGPINGNKNLGLFAVAEGKLVVYNTKKSEKAPTEIDTPDDTFVYTFAWKPDYTMLVVGTKSGSVILYSEQLKIVSIHYFQHRLKEIYWHPHSVQSDLENSKYCYWFAAISNSKDVIVCNFQTGIEDGDKIVAKLERSEDIVNCVAWSPYTSNELVIAGDEGTAQVWDVQSDAITSTYTSPNFEGVSAVIWSPIDSDFVISGVKDHTIRVWRISDHPKQDEKCIKQLRKKLIKEITDEQTDLLPKVEKTQEEVPKNKKTTKTNLLPNFYYPKDASHVVDDLRKLFLWKEGSYGGEVGGGDTSSDILKVYGSKNDMLNIMEQNETIHQEKGKYNLSNTLSLFKGDIGTKIKRAIDEKRVNPWIITMAPMVSPKVWQSACETYAQQLSEIADSDPLEIATYYLACHKVEEAIDVLCEGAMYREALALAKCRLPEDSPTLTGIMEKWAKYSVIVGNFEAAAQCYIYLGKYENAASVLFRRSDNQSLKFAMELAAKSGNEDLHSAVLFRYNAFKKENVAEEEESVLPSRLDVALNQNLENEFRDQNKVSEESVSIGSKNEEKILDCNGENKDKESLTPKNCKVEQHKEEKMMEESSITSKNEKILDCNGENKDKESLTAKNCNVEQHTEEAFLLKEDTRKDLHENITEENLQDKTTENESVILTQNTE